MLSLVEEGVQRRQRHSSNVGRGRALACGIDHEQRRRVRHLTAGDEGLVGGIVEVELEPDEPSGVPGE
jgi:hypothetical protein